MSYTLQHLPARKNALLVSCMDLRLIDNIVKFMEADNMTNRYDQYIAAGCSLGIEKNANWRQSFFDHLKLACDLHHIHDVYILEHRNCGAYKEFLGKDGDFGVSTSEQKREFTTHKKYADQLKKDIQKWAKENKYDLTVQNFLMDLRGHVGVLK
jgi:carbonic anhydrase